MTPTQLLYFQVMFEKVMPSMLSLHPHMECHIKCTFHDVFQQLPLQQFCFCDYAYYKLKE